MFLMLTTLGCGLVDWFTDKVDETVDQQGIDALESAIAVVKEAEASPARKRVLKIMRRLRRDIDADEKGGINGNVVAAIVKKVASDGSITGIEAGAVEDAYNALVKD